MNQLQAKINEYFNKCIAIVKGELKPSRPGEEENRTTRYWWGVAVPWRLFKDKYCNLMERKANGSLTDNDILVLWNAHGGDTRKPGAAHPAGGIRMDNFPKNANPMTTAKKSFPYLKELAYNTDEKRLDECNQAICSEYPTQYHSRIHRFATTFNPKLLNVYSNKHFDIVLRWFARHGYYAKGETWFQQSVDLQAYIDNCVTYPEGYSEYEKQYISILFGCYLWWIIDV